MFSFVLFEIASCIDSFLKAECFTSESFQITSVNLRIRGSCLILVKDCLFEILNISWQSVELYLLFLNDR
jgi:hypothetical protein